MKKVIGFLLCTAFYIIFFVWAKSYEDETIREDVLIFFPIIFMIIFSSVFSYLCLGECRFGWALGLGFGIFVISSVFLPRENMVASIAYCIYLVVLWILSLELSFSEGGDSGDSGDSGGSGGTRDWTDGFTKEQADFILHNI